MTMKNYLIGLNLIITLSCLPLLAMSCSEEITRPEVTTPLMPDLGPEGTAGSVGLSNVTRTTICQAGTNVDVYRIPSIVTARDGSLLVFCEWRHESWRDKSYTDIVVRRSTDDGKTWSQPQNLTGSINSGEFAYMDPTPVVDEQTGEIFLFCTRWNELDTDATKNRAFRISSTDHGATWSAPKDVSDEIIVPGLYSGGFGPGHGITIREGQHAGRLVVITRQSNGSRNTGYAVYSDDHGKTWRYGSSTNGAESQIAESGVNRLYLNLRQGESRYTTTSVDGGESWSPAMIDNSLPVVSGGCQASVLGTGNNMVFYCGPKGGVRTDTNDNRSGLTLFRSAVGGSGWTRKQELYTLASGYSDMTLLQDGRLAIVFEAGPEQGFTLSAQRPAGWMRLDLIICPKEITDYDYWFEQ